jgi:hypothetical protein
MPWQVQNTEVKLTVNNPNLKKAIVLDSAGYKLREITGKVENGQFSVRLPEDSFYVVLE